MNELEKAENNVELWKNIHRLATAMCFRDIVLVCMILWLVYLTCS